MRWRELLQLDETLPLPADFFSAARNVHFIGVGGIGMSALALLLRARGHAVSGSDASASVTLTQLQDAGVTTWVGQSQREAAGEIRLAAAEAVFYSSAISPENEEFRAAQAAGIPCWHRSQLLAHLSNAAKFSVAVSGTHGKSTTSAMVAHILTARGQNPTAILGAVYPPFGSNFRLGDPDVVVVEADESDGSFTLLKPTVAVVLNVEPEHLENYSESEAELWRAFEMFTAGATAERVLNAGQAGLLDRLDPEGQAIDFETGRWEQAALFAGKINPAAGRTAYDLHYLGFHGDTTDLDKDGPAGRFYLPVPGVHNVANALAASAACWPRGIAPHEAAEALQSFAGTLRRFEKKGDVAGVVFYDDYGHHPTEVRATLDAARDFLQRPLTVIFQPHRYSRTQQLGRDFGPAFGAAETVIITQLYSAFEEPIPGVSGRIVYDAVRATFPAKTVFYAENLDAAGELALQHLRAGSALLTMGAGNITGLGPQLMRAWEARHGQ